MSAYYIDDDFVKAEGSARIIARLSPYLSASELNEFLAYVEKDSVSTLKDDIRREMKRNETAFGGLFSVVDIEEILDKLKVT